MNDWRPFDIKSFLKASRHWDDDIKKLQAEHDALSELPAAGNNPGRSSEVSDLTANAALRRLEIQKKIEDIKLYKEMLDYALKMLSNEDKRLIEGFYYPRKAIGVFVWEYGREKGLCKNKVYEQREIVLQKMARTIENVYYGDD